MCVDQLVLVFYMHRLKHSTLHTYIYILLHASGSPKTKSFKCQQLADSLACWLEQTLAGKQLLAYMENINQSELPSAHVCFLNIYFRNSTLQSLSWNLPPTFNLRKEKKYCLIMSQDEGWLVRGKVWELSQLGWLAGGWYTLIECAQIISWLT